jgi:hypothetical protein
MRAMSKVNHPFFDRVVCEILSRLVLTIPRQILARAQNFLLISIPCNLKSPIVISHFVKLRMLQVSQLDRLFTDLLDADPFSLRNASFVLLFLKAAIREAKIFPENDVISTLGALYSINRFCVENSQVPPLNLLQVLDEFQKSYEDMDAPSLQLSSTSKLQFASIFDPLEDIQDAHRISELLQQWKSVSSTNLPSERDMEEIMRECVSCGKNMLISVLFSESERVCCQFVSNLVALVGLSDDLADALITVIGGNANVVGFDLRKFYSVLRLLLELCEDLIRYAVLLHELRPLVMPSFTFNWIAVVADKNLVFKLLRNQSTWASYSVLILDFAGLIAHLDPKDTHCPFTFVYKAFLRLMLVLAHDCRPFLGAISSILVSVIPFHCAQIRNLALSAFEGNCPVELFGTDEILKALPQRYTAALAQLFGEGTFDGASLNSILAQLDKKPDSAFLRCFLRVVCGEFATFKKTDRIEESLAFAVLSEAFSSVSPDLALAIIHTLVDQVRCKSPESSFFVRLINALFMSDVQVLPQISLAEPILVVVLERAATPPPRPAKLATLVRKLLAPGGPGRDIWSMPFVTGNVRDFLVAVRTVFTKRQ